MSLKSISIVVSVVILIFTTQGLVAAQSPVPIELEADPGNASIELFWNATNGVDVTHYRISRAVQGANFTVIQDNWQETTFFDENSTLVKDTIYCYQVEAIQNDGQVYVTSDQACATYGQLSLWVPHLNAKVDEQHVIVPVNIRNANGLQIGATDIWLNFDPAIIASVAISRTSLTAGYAWQKTIQETDAGQRVRIAAIQTDNQPELYGDGSLFWLVFNVVGPAGSQTPLDIQDFVSGEGGGGSTIYTPDNLFDHVPLNINDGILTVETEQEVEYILGDLNGNGVVQAVDALIALFIASGRIEPTIEQQFAGDINGNEVVEAADASMILYHAGHGEWPPPPTTSARMAHNARAIQTTIKLSSGVSGSAGQIVEVMVQATNLRNFAGGKFVIAYDPAVVSGLAEATPTGLASGFTRYDAYDNGQGLITLTLADDAEISGNGDLMKVRLQLANNITDSESTLRLADAKLNDIYGRDFVTSFADNTITRQNTQIALTNGIPVYLPMVIK